MATIVGIDPSLTCTGVAVIEADHDVTTVDTWRAKTTRTGSTLRDTRTRLRRAIGLTLERMPRRVDVCVIEVPHSAHQYGGQNERVALYWWLVDQMMARGPVVQVAPSQRAKLATGSGRATKDDVVAAMRAAYPHARIPDDNVADALAMAHAGHYWAAPDTAPAWTSLRQLEAFNAIDWPPAP